MDDLEQAVEMMGGDRCGRCGAPFRDGWCLLRCEDVFEDGAKRYTFLNRLADQQVKNDIALFKAVQAGMLLDKQNRRLMIGTLVLAGMIVLLATFRLIGL